MIGYRISRRDLEAFIEIVTLYPQLERLANGAAGAVKTETQKIVEGFTAPNSAHTNCARSFRHLFERDPTEAKAIFDRAWGLITSLS